MFQVNVTNLEDYVSFVADATVKAGITRQVEAFKSGFNQVCTVMKCLFMQGGRLNYLNAFFISV